jgi:trk system potassium uptake protein TrkA
MYILIAGGGLVGGELARRLLQTKHDVVVVDPERDTCDKLYAESGIVAVHGPAGRIDVLKEAGIDKADVVVAATPYDAENLACAVLAKSRNVPRIIVRMRDPDYESAYRLAGAHTIVRVTDMMVNHMIIDIENPRIQRIFTIGEGQAVIFKITIPEKAKIIGKSIMDIAQHPRFLKQCIVLGAHDKKQGIFTIPRGDYTLQADNELYLVSRTREIDKIITFLTSQ